MTANIKNMDKEKNGFVALAIILIVLVLVIGGFFYFKNSSILTDLLNKAKNVNPQNQAVSQSEITITDQGFIPATIKIKKNTQVKWKNMDKVSHQVASDPHPTHTGLPGLESPALLTNDSYSFTFDKTGAFTYHDHLNPFKFKGTVIVE